MPPKYSTRRHKYKNKNKKQNKSSKHKVKPGALDPPKRRIDRPAEVVFDNKERVDFVTGFAKRKQQRRVRAAQDLIEIQHQQQLETRQERRDEEIECLVKGGFMDDPLISFLGDNSDGSESDSSSSSETAIDLNDMVKKKEDAKQIEYENDDMITTVVTSIPSEADRNKQFLDVVLGPVDGDVDKEVTSSNAQEANSVDWMFTSKKPLSKDGETTLSLYDKRREAQKVKETTDGRKKYNRKVKKMMSFVKEFNRTKKRRANAKHSKRKPRSGGGGGKSKGKGRK